MTTEYLLEEICQLTIENKELKAKNEYLESIISGVAFLPNVIIGDYQPVVSLELDKFLADIKAEAVRDYEASLSSFPWTAEEYIEKMIRGKS